MREDVVQDPDDVPRVGIRGDALDDVVDPDEDADEVRPQTGERRQLVPDQVGRGVPVDPEVGDELERRAVRARGAATSRSGQRSAAATEVPIVYESPSAT